jgi:hypothetical protein
VTGTPQRRIMPHVYDVAANTATVFGIGKVEDLTWKGMLDLGTCTECGVACQLSDYRGHLPARTPARDHTEVMDQIFRLKRGQQTAANAAG